MERMSTLDGEWSNIFLELRVGNTYSAVASIIEELKKRLEAMKALELLKSTASQNTSPKSS